MTCDFLRMLPGCSRYKMVAPSDVVVGAPGVFECGAMRNWLVFSVWIGFGFAEIVQQSATSSPPSGRLSRSPRMTAGWLCAFS
jgi:hypothetical protein